MVTPSTADGDGLPEGGEALALPGGGQEGAERLGGHGGREQVALAGLAALSAEEFQLALGLDPLADHGQPQAPRHLDDGPDDRAAIGVMHFRYSNEE